MNILIVHVGNAVEGIRQESETNYLIRKDLISGKLRTYLKQDITNADSQMNSLIDQGVDIEYGHFSERKSFKKNLQAGLKIRKLSEHSDLVHVLWGSTTALITVLFSKKPVVISYCGSDLMGATNANGKMTKGGVISRWFSRVSAHFARQIILKSEKMKADLPLNVLSKTIVIPNGVNTQKFHPKNQEECKIKLGWDLRKKYVLFFYTEGQVVKNVEMANAVLDKVKQELPETELFVASGIPHQDLLFYYNAADVMILTSHHEGSNNSLKEANICNTPIVSVDVGDASQRLNGVKNSYILKDFEIEPFANKVIKVLESNKRSNGSIDLVNVSEENIAKMVINVYQNVLTA